jgi:hypothetical protein
VVRQRRVATVRGLSICYSDMIILRFRQLFFRFHPRGIMTQLFYYSDSIIFKISSDILLILSIIFLFRSVIPRVCSLIISSPNICLSVTFRLVATC